MVRCRCACSQTPPYSFEGRPCEGTGACISTRHLRREMLMAVISSEARGGERVRATTWWSRTKATLTPGHRRGRCARRERALPVDRVARAWQASARRRPTDRRTWNVETANRLLHFRREGTRRHGTGGLVIEHHRPFPVCVSARELGSLRCATAGLLGVCSGSLL